MERELCPVCDGFLGDNPEYCSECNDHVEERRADSREDDR